MQLTATSIKFPPKLKREAKKLVNKGYFKSFSDLVTFATRLVIGGYHPQHAADEVHRLRKRMWDIALKKANGNEDKAADFLIKEYKKHAEEMPIYKSIPKARLYNKS